MDLDFVTLWRALAPGDLPGPVPEYRFHPVRRWRFDFAWPSSPRGGVAVEVDGGQWRAGGGRHNTDRDREKLNTAAALGWRVLRFSHAALETDPAGCVELAAAALVLGDGGQFGGDLPGPGQS
jgi:very-short-patch-repair endonuclease